MIAKTQYIIPILMLFLTLLGLSACVDDDWKSGGEDGPSSEGKVRVKLIAGADGYKLPVTRADEDAVNRLWIFVFKGEGGNAQFVEAHPVVYSKDNNNNTYHGTVEIKPQSSKCQLLLIANPPTDFYLTDGMTSVVLNEENLNREMTNQSLGTVCDRMLLTSPLSDPQTVLPYDGQVYLPMSSITPVNGIVKNQTVSAHSLERVVAKMIVRNIAVSNFTLEGVFVVRSVPPQRPLHRLAAAPAVVADATQYATGSNADIAPATAGTGFEATAAIYLNEFSQTSLDPTKTGIIIHGYYKGKEFYYKMAFVATDLSPLSIVRNTDYTFTIVRVEGEGHETLEDAINAPFFNNVIVHAELTVTNPSGFEITAGTDYYMAVSNSHYMVYGGTPANLTPFTLVLQGRNSEAIEGYVNAIDGVQFSAAQPAGVTRVNERRVSFKTVVNEAVSTREVKVDINGSGTLEIVYGNTKKLVTVVHAGASSSNIDLNSVYYFVGGEVINGNAKLYSANNSNGYNKLSVDDGLLYVKGASAGTIVYLATGANPNNPNVKYPQRIKIEVK